jgi:hypothetical protein
MISRKGSERFGRNQEDIMIYGIMAIDAMDQASSSAKIQNHSLQKRRRKSKKTG